MAFVPVCECDVFISYATANNQSFTKDKPGWVSSVRDALRLVLDEGLDRRGVSEIWMDYKLRGNEPFDEQLRHIVSRTAILVIVLSEAYLKSDWCRRELEIFSEAVGDQQGRIFLIHYEPVPFDSWPQQLRGLSSEKYRFFQQERDGAISKPLGYPIPNPEIQDHHSFYDRLLELRSDLAVKLDEIASSGEEISPPSAGSATQTPSGPAVFLAEVCGETLYDQRQLVKSHLEQCDIRVLPSRPTGRAPTEEMDRELAESKLFVQMLGRFGGGYEADYYDRAVATEIPILRWRSRDLDLNSINQLDHRKLLENSVQALDFDELKRSIVDQVRLLSVKRDAPVSEGERFILVNAAPNDLHVADVVADQLGKWNVGYDVVDDKLSLQDLVESNKYDALMVIYGSCQHDWVRQQLIECRRILLDQRSDAPLCAVYIGPPDEKQPLRCRPPRVAVIDPHNDDGLRAFIDELSAPGI